MAKRRPLSLVKPDDPPRQPRKPKTGDEPLDCPRCGSTVMVVAKTEMVWRDGRPVGGQTTVFCKDCDAQVY